MRTKLIFTGIVAFTGLIFNSLSAQNVGIGFQLGDPTGLNLQFKNRSGGMHPDILLAWDANDGERNFFFVNVHGLWFKRLGAREPFNFYYGPGAFAGVRDRRKKENDNETVIGFSGNFGLNYEFSRLDIFARLTPRLSVIPGTDFNMGGGFGLRFWL